MRTRDYPPPTNIREALALVLRREMGARGWTAKHVEGLVKVQPDAPAGLSAQNLTRWVLPGLRELSSSQTYALAVALGTTPSALYGAAEELLPAASVTSRSAEPAVQSDGKAGWIGPDRRKDHATRARFDELAGTGSHAGEDVDTGSS